MEPNLESHSEGLCLNTKQKKKPEPCLIPYAKIKSHQTKLDQKLACMSKTIKLSVQLEGKPFMTLDFNHGFLISGTENTSNKEKADNLGFIIIKNFSA